MSLPSNDSSAPPKPNFFIIGAPKCGTTSLSEYLKDHPQIFFSEVKEPQYFDFDLSKKVPLSLESYLKLFDKADPKLHSRIGEGSTTYLFSKVAVAEILKFNPNAKFIVMLRNPVEFVQSWHSENLFHGHETIADFEKAWRAESDRKKGGKVPFFCPEPKKLLYSEWGNFGEQIARLFDIIPREDVKVILFEDLTSKTKEIYEEVLTFLGLQLDRKKTFNKFNENKILRSPLLQQFLRLITNAKNQLGISKNFGLFKVFHKINLKRGVRRPIPLAAKEKLTEYFQNDILRLSKLLNRDLSHWLAKETRSQNINTNK